MTVQQQEPRQRKKQANTVVLSKPQTKILNSRAELILDMAGQRAGKSQMIGVITGLFVMKFPRLRQFVAANTYLQLTQSTLVKATEIWKDLYGLSRYDRKSNPTGDYVIDKVPPPDFHRWQEYKDYNNIISFRNGAVIYLGSLDNYLAHDGKEFGIAHLDETKQTKKQAVTDVIIARLSQSGLEYDVETKELYWVEEEAISADQLDNYYECMGKDFEYEVREELAPHAVTKSWRPLYVHTSPAEGTVDWINEMFDLNSQEKEIRAKISKGREDYYHRLHDGIEVVIYPTHHNEDNLPPGYIEARGRVLSEAEYLKLVCGYPFSKSGGEYFPHFLRSKHLGELPYFEKDASHLSLDYNVLPYMSGIASQTRFETRYIDIYGVKHNDPAPDRRRLQVMVIYTYRIYPMREPNNTVIDLCDAFKAEHEPKTVFLYGDAAGRSRIAGLGSYTHVREIETQLYKYVYDGCNRVPKVNMGVMRRRDIMNRIFEGKIPNIEIVIHPACHELIRDLEYVKLGVDGKHKEWEEDKATGRRFVKLGHMSDAYEYFVCELVKDLIPSHY